MNEALLHGVWATGLVGVFTIGTNVGVTVSTWGAVGGTGVLVTVSVTGVCDGCSGVLEGSSLVFCGLLAPVLLIIGALHERETAKTNASKTRGDTFAVLPIQPPYYPVTV